MEVSKQPYLPSKSWKKHGLNIDICEINRTFKHKKRKLTDIILEDSLIEGEKYGVCVKKGKYRKQMEDAYNVVLDLHNTSLKHAFALFDGHSGTDASVFASKNLIQNISSTDENGITQAFKLTDYIYCMSNPKQGGTTVALGILDRTHLLTANIGDTKIILVKENSYKILSYDHVASDLEEQNRIEMAGGFVIRHGNIMRVNGNLAITRSIGDFKYKSCISSTPYIRDTKLDIDDIALVIASDGLFETLPPEQVSEIVRDKKFYKPSEIAETLAMEAIETGSRDNVSVIVVNVKEYYTLACSQTDRNKKKTFEF